MSRYLSQLMRQSGLKVAPPLELRAPATPAAPPLPLGTSEIVEHEALAKVGLPITGPAPAPVAHSEISHAPAAHEQLESAQSPVEQVRSTRSEQASLDLARGKPVATGAEAEIPAAVQSQLASQAVPPSAQTPTTTSTPLMAERETPATTIPSSADILRQVMAWIADAGEVPQPGSSASSRALPAPPVDQPTVMQTATVAEDAPADLEKTAVSLGRSPAPDPGPSVRAAAAPLDRVASRTPANSQVEPWSVQIGMIHLTIEAPLEKPAPRSTEPRVVRQPPPLSSRDLGSRLQRHYLRRS